MHVHTHKNAHTNTAGAPGIHGVPGMQMSGAPPLPGMPPGMPSMGAGAHSGMPGLPGMMHGMPGVALQHTPNTPHRTPKSLQHIAKTWRDAWGMPFREM